MIVSFVLQDLSTVDTFENEAEHLTFLEQDQYETIHMLSVALHIEHPRLVPDDSWDYEYNEEL